MTDETLAAIKHQIIQCAYNSLAYTAWEKPTDIPAYRDCMRMWKLCMGENPDRKRDTLWYFVKNKFAIIDENGEVVK